MVLGACCSMRVCSGVRDVVVLGVCGGVQVYSCVRGVC